MSLPDFPEEKERDGENVLMETCVGSPKLKTNGVVDANINVFNPEEVEWAIATRFQATKT